MRKNLDGQKLEPRNYFNELWLSSNHQSLMLAMVVVGGGSAVADGGVDDGSIGNGIGVVVVEHRQTT